MYKLFLCFRYLRKLLMAYFAILCVALCVAMMLIVTSVMNGFLDKIENAAKGLFGDVVIDAPGLGGMAYYDEFITELKQEVPQVQAATPFVLAYGILSIPQTDHRQTVQIAGIRLPQRAHTTDFAKGLFVQKDLADPSFDPKIDLVTERMAEAISAAERIIERLDEEIVSTERQTNEAPGDKIELRSRVLNALRRLRRASAVLSDAAPYQQKLAELQQKLDAAQKSAGGTVSNEIIDLEEQIGNLEDITNLNAPADRVMLGLGLPALSFRTPRGETVRVVGPGEKVELTLIPLGRRLSAVDLAPANAQFTVIDDCSTDIASIDSSIVYVPFETLQRLNNMGPEYSAENPSEVAIPGRCGQIHIKLRENFATGRDLLEARENINRFRLDFIRRYPTSRIQRPLIWQEHQARLVGPIQQQRTLTVIMFAIISLVSVVLIFVIFYMIVYQKVRDIGVLKSVGASSSGVAWIFLVYGAAVGLVGSILGTIGGYYFVRYINEIQDALDRWWGFRVWSREVFLFARIPDQVEVLPILLIVAGAIVAGLVGALIPAIRAASMQPVEALRYE